MFDTTFGRSVATGAAIFALAGGLDLTRHGRHEDAAANASCEFRLVPGLSGSCITDVTYTFNTPGAYQVNVATDGNLVFGPEAKSFSVIVPPETSSDNPFRLRDAFPSYQPVTSFVVAPQE